MVYKKVLILFIFTTVFFDQVSSSSLEEAKELFQKGVRAFAYKDYDRARLFFQQAELNGYIDGKMFFFLAYIYEKYGLYNIAYSYYKKALEDENLPKRFRDAALVQIDRYRRDFSKYDFVLQKLFSNSEFSKVKVYINYVLDTKNEKARQFFSNALKSSGLGNRKRLLLRAIFESPDYFRAYLYLSDIYRRKELYFSAKEILSIFLRENFTLYAPFLYRMGDIFLGLDLYGEALEYFNKGYKFSLNDSMKKLIILKMIILDLLMKRNDDAFSLYERIKDKISIGLIKFIFEEKKCSELKTLDIDFSKLFVFLLKVGLYNKAKCVLDNFLSERKDLYLVYYIVVKDFDKALEVKGDLVLLKNLCFFRSREETSYILYKLYGIKDFDFCNRIFGIEQSE